MVGEDEVGTGSIMAYDEGLAARIADQLEGEPGLVEKKMFGGLAFLVEGHMCVGIVGDELMVRVGPEAYEEALAEEGARPMDFTGKPMRGLVYVAAEAVAEEPQLAEWIGRGLRFVRGLPPKGA